MLKEWCHFGFKMESVMSEANIEVKHDHQPFTDIFEVFFLQCIFI